MMAAAGWAAASAMDRGRRRRRRFYRRWLGRGRGRLRLMAAAGFAGGGTGDGDDGDDGRCTGEGAGDSGSGGGGAAGGRPRRRRGLQAPTIQLRGPITRVYYKLRVPACCRNAACSASCWSWCGRRRPAPRACRRPLPCTCFRQGYAQPLLSAQQPQEGYYAWSHRPQGPGGPARAYRYRLALRRPYRYLYRRWVRVDGGRRAL